MGMGSLPHHGRFMIRGIGVMIVVVGLWLTVPWTFCRVEAAIEAHRCVDDDYAAMDCFA